MGAHSVYKFLSKMKIVEKAIAGLNELKQLYKLFKHKSVARKVLFLNSGVLLVFIAAVEISLVVISDKLQQDERLQIETVSQNLADNVHVAYLTQNTAVLKQTIQNEMDKSNLVESVSIFYEDNKVITCPVEGYSEEDSVSNDYVYEDIIVSIQAQSRVVEHISYLETVAFFGPVMFVIFIILLNSYLKRAFTNPINSIVQTLNFYESEEFERTLEKKPMKRFGNELDNLAVALDVTYDSKKLKVKHNQVLEQEIEKALRSKNAFIASMAHDFKTPLVSLAGLNEEVFGSIPKDNEEVVSLLNAMNSVVFDMETMVLNLLEFSKLDSGEGLGYEEESAHLYGLVNSVVKSFHFLASTKKNYITVSVQPNIGHVMIDARKYRQVLRNLISNAVKYTEEGEIHIEVYFLQGQKRILTTVTDSGVGVSNNVIDSMFVPFKREKDDLTEGTGIGLSFSQSMLRGLDCTIDFKNNLAKGAQFWFDFPCERFWDLERKEPDNLAVVDISIEPIQSHVINYLTHALNVKIVPMDYYKPERISAVYTDRMFYLDKDDLAQLKPGFKGMEGELYKQVRFFFERGIPVIPVFKKEVSNKSKLSIMGFQDPVTIQGLEAGVEDYFWGSQKEVPLEKMCVPEELQALKVLLVDDNIVYLQLVEKRMRSFGFSNIDLARDGMEAVESFKANRYDVVLIDHMMPILDGIDATKQIKEIDSSVLVLGFTAAKNELKGKEHRENLMDFVFLKDLSRFNAIVVRNIIDKFKEEKPNA